MAAVALAATPGLAMAKPSERRDHGAAVSFPLLALPAKGGGVTPAAHYSHSSHESHSSHISHYSGTHNSHASHSSHSSHFSSSPASPSPTPTPTPRQTTATPQPSSPTATTPSHAHGQPGPGLRHHKSASPSSVPRHPIKTISPKLTGNHDGGGPGAGADAAVIVVVLATGLTVYIIYRRKKHPR